jgi:Glycosyl transferases group 1.
MTMSMRKVGLLYLGRLEKEKGFDLILNMVEKYEKELPFELYVFGKGSRETSLLELQKKYKQIHFF